MAISRNRVVSRLLQVRAVTTGQRPVVLERRLRREVRAVAAGEFLSPSQAWAAYGRSMDRRCFSTNGWLVQFGVYEFGGTEQFHFSLVRQFETLQTWNDEYVQLNLLVYHEPTAALRELGHWHHWSSKHPSLAAFRQHCEKHEGVGKILADGSSGWRWEIQCGET